MFKGPHESGSSPKVAVIGGGPAGCFFALYLLRYGSENRTFPQITLYEQRNFDEQDPRGCKGCAGVLSIPLLRDLRELDMSIPEEAIQNRVERYAVHSPYTSISISSPEKLTPIVSIFRGSGRWISYHGNPLSFDAWLVNEVQKRGVIVENRRVSAIHLGNEAEVEVAGRRLGYDLVVLASGVNSLPVPTFGVDYVPPETRRMVMGELYVGTEKVRSLLGEAAHVFLIPHSGLIFGTLVPKGPFINVSVLSRGTLPVSITDFLNHTVVRSMVPDSYEHICGCRPLAAIGSGRNYYANRFVVIGDAAVSRLYKDGIGSSLMTAREAARTVITHGLSHHDFQRHYEPLCRGIARDNRWGRFLFWINDHAKNSRTFLLAQHRLIGDEQYHVRLPQSFTRAAWGMFSGTYKYRRIAGMVFRPTSVAKLFSVLSRQILMDLTDKKAVYPRRLYVGHRRVMILGSGFGGTYVLRHLVPSLNRNENVETTLISDENFFLFSPLLHQVAMGGIETRHIAYPIRRLHWRDRFDFVQARVEKIDLKSRNVVTTAGTFDFDYLVLALGSVTDLSELNAVGKNLFTLKTLQDSMLIRNHIIGIFEEASTQRDTERLKQRLTFVVAGCGYIAVQLVAELRDFIFRNLVRFYRTIDLRHIRVILVEAEPGIAAEFHPELGAYAMKQLLRMGIELRLGSRVTRVSEGSVEINGKELVPTATVIWKAAGVANPCISELDVEKDDIGRVLVNEHLELPDAPGIYAIGDCAHFKDPGSGKPVPPRAYVAVREARIVAENILAEIRGGDKKPFHHASGPEMISLGASKAALRFNGVTLYGFPAYLIWFVLYTSLVTGTYNRLRVLTDRLLSVIFGRDITYLKLMK